MQHTTSIIHKSYISHCIQYKINIIENEQLTIKLLSFIIVL